MEEEESDLAQYTALSGYLAGTSYKIDKKR